MRSAIKRLEAESERQPRARQVELGTRGVLILFFALAVVCGMFFAFGYTLGKHAIPATFKLGSSPTQAALQAPVVPAAGSSTPSGVQPPNPAELGAAESNQTPSTLLPPTAPAAGTGGAAAPAASTPPPADAAAANPGNAPTGKGGANTAAQPLPGKGPYLVQVFAGKKTDADSLAAALQQRGYPVQIAAPAAAGEADLFRVQVGPYLTLDEAEAMRSRLIADGYQAIIK